MTSDQVGDEQSAGKEEGTESALSHPRGQPILLIEPEGRVATVMSLRDDLEKPVIDFATRKLIMIDEGDSVSQAAKKMAENGR